ncbi:MAG TPA: DUF5916 domain-containing protein [Vicinamibacterales bacterium]
MRVLLAVFSLLFFFHVVDASAQQNSGPSSALVIDGPPAPVEENGMARDEATGKSTIRAIKLREPLNFDGRLDDAVYESTSGFGGMLQASPRYGEPSTERTEIWVMFDGENIYVAAKCYDAAPPDRWIANELRRDTNQMRQNDHFGVGFDTFYDRRSGYMFYANPLGGFSDYSVIDEGAPNTDWNPVWDVRTGRFDGGWTVEMKFPFKSLRYISGSDRIWGIQFRRSIRHKNEWTYWTPVPQNMAGPQALNRVSSFGTVVGLDLPPAGRNLEIKPYALGKMTTDRVANPPTRNDNDGDVGGDVKYGVTANLTADLTINTDFAQVEIDEQQVNLTRFNLFLPEKREFFLEGRGLFDFGRGGSASGGGPGFGGTTDAPYMFYSRRIGLNRGRVVPIDAGGRLTGKVGAWGVGLLNIQTGDEAASASPSTNFTVARIKRDILRRSTIGAMFTNRNHLTSNAAGSNQAYGVDAALGFYQNVAIGAYYARTQTSGVSGDDESYQGKFDWVPDRYGIRAEVLKVGRAFNPEVGFLRRTDFTRSFASARFSPRPQNMRAVRKFTYEANFEYYENGAGAVESRQSQGRFNVELDNSDVLNVEANANYDLLVTPFTPSPGVAIPVGGYHYNDVLVSYNMGTQRRLSGTLGVQLGQYYNGTIKALTFSQGRYAILKQFSVEPRLSINRIELPAGAFTQKQFGARTDYGFSPRMFASALLQYSSVDRTFSSNVRFRWEYRPGSEFFVVWTDEQNTNPLDPRDQFELRNRAFVVKMTRLFRF